MASILPNGKTQFIDQNGAPLAGGQVFFYAPGTSNPQATYKDQALTIANTNPIQLDSRGQAVIWGSGTYRQVVQDASGVTIWDQVIADVTAGVSAQISGLSTNLSAATGSGLVGFEQPGGAAQPRTVQAKLQEALITPQDFMTAAQINDVYLRTAKLDVSGAIQAAVNAANGGVVTLPPGYYGMTAGVTVSTATVLQGAGRNGTVFVPNGSFNAFTFSGGSQGAGMYGVGFSAANHTGDAIHVNGADRTTFSDILLSSPYNCIYVTVANVCSIRNMWANGIRGSYGIQWYGDTADRSDVLDIENVQMSCATNSVGASGIIMDGNVNTLSFRHVACTKMGRGLWVKNSSGGSNPAFVTGYDLQVDYPLNEAVRVEGSARSIFLDDIYAHGSVQSDGIYIDASVQNVEIRGGQIDSNYNRGIFAGGRYIRISNALLSNNSMAGSAAAPGIEIGGASIGVTINGGLSGQWVGYASNNQSYGVLIDAGAQAYSVIGVNLRNNVTADFLDNANDGTSIVFGNVASASTPDKIPGPLQSMTGDLLLNAVGLNTVKLGNATNGTGFAAQPSATNSVNYLKAYGNSAGGSPTLQAVGADANIDLKIATTGTGVLQANSANMWAANGTTAASLGSTSPGNASPQKWLMMKDQSGNKFYIPCF